VSVDSAGEQEKLEVGKLFVNRADSQLSLHAVLARSFIGAAALVFQTVVKNILITCVICDYT
jgi:hypothetical protein